MTRDEFKEALAIAGEKYKTDEAVLRKRAKKQKVLKISIACAAGVFALAAVTAVMLLKRPKTPAANSGNDILLGIEPTQRPEETAEPVNDQPGEAGVLNVKRLSYSGIDDRVFTLNAENFGANLISAKVKGIHEKCRGVFYDQQNDQITCLDHEFLEASGLTIPEKSYLEFVIDRPGAQLVAVEIKEITYFRTQDLWIMDRGSGTAMRLELPEGCDSYGDISLSDRSFAGGILCMGINTGNGKHFISAYDTNTGETVRVAESTDGSGMYARFLSDRVLEIGKGGVKYLFNIDSNIMAELVGEYNYCSGDKVYSVKKWGWANHNDVTVAAYDANTGEILANENVLVQTVEDDGTNVFLLKNTTSGDETVILENFSENCSGWSSDFSCFYAYSGTSGKLICYFSESQTVETAFIESVDRSPVEIDGHTYAVFVNYSLAIGDKPGDVTVYYTRSLQEVKEAPMYEDEAVDSPYWDEYRDIKFRNFPDETSFEYADKGRIKDNYVYGRQINDMTLLRDIILECLEAKGPLYKDFKNENDEGVMVGHLYCGDFRIIFYQYGETLCVTMPRNMSPIAEYDDAGVYEFPESVFQNIEKRIDEYFNTLKGEYAYDF